MKNNEYKNHINNFKMMISRFSNFYYKDPDSYVKRIKSTNLERVFLDFIEFTFCKYDCHSSFKNVWYEVSNRYFKNLYTLSGSDKEYKEKSLENIARNYSFSYAYFLQLFLSQVSGGSVYKEYFKGIFTKKESSIIIKPKMKDFSVEENMVFAIAYQHSKNISASIRVSKSKIPSILRKVLTNYLKYDKNSFFNLFGEKIAFIRSCVIFFTNIEPDSVNEIDDIMDFFLNEFEENNSFSPLGKKYTIETVRKKTESWHRELRRVRVIGNGSWVGHPLDDSKYELGKEENYRIWTFSQIRKGKDLAKEGNLMRHCVYGYKNGCISGDISIWSLKINGKRAVTIELSNSGKIKQARGKANRRIKNEEKEIINKWASDNFLDFSLRC